ncbi:type II toxin-antitoxin system HicA family toxin [Phormidesmis sp. 146-35]
MFGTQTIVFGTQTIAFHAQSKHKQNRFIASCRTAAYHSRFRQFKDVEMADFDDVQIQQFITNWFQSEQDKQFGIAEKCWERLQEPEYSATKELAQTPLLLTLLCLVFDDSQAFPKNRAVLYGDVLDVLLKKWAAEKRIQRDPIYKDLSVALEEMMLGEIAYAGFVRNRLFFSRREVVQQICTFLESNLNAPKHLDGKEVLKAIQIQQGILVERAADVLSFSHLTIQEYLVAQHIADHNLIEELVAGNIAERRWRDVAQNLGSDRIPNAHRGRITGIAKCFQNAMSKKRKLLEKILAGSKNIQFDELVSLIEAFGFTLSRISGSHHIFTHPDIPEIVNIQNKKGKAIPYQVHQFIILIEEYALTLETKTGEDEP